MSKVVFGEIDWNSGDVAEGGGGNKKSDFMQLDVGKSRVRVMGNPTQFYVHWIETPDGKKKKVNSPISDPKLVKELVDAGFKRQVRWIVKVLDRTDSEFKLLEIGSQIYNGIKALYLDEDWGPVTAYDVTIERGPAGQQPLYRVTPRPKSPLEASYKEAYVAFNDRVDLTKFTQPAEPEKVRELMGWDTGSVSKSGSASTSSSMVDDDDDLFSFES